MNIQIRQIMSLPYKDLYSYWQHYWSHCIEKLTDKDNVSFKIVGPRMLIADLLDELEGHGLSNQDNIAYFRSQISEIDKFDTVFRALCHSITACLLHRLGNKTNKESCIILCRKILTALTEKHYFILLVDWLADTIDTTSNSNYENRQKINNITHLVIAEYIAEGFVLGEIKKYATEIPDVSLGVGGIIIGAPHEFRNLKENDYSSKEDYYNAISKLIQKWTTQERLNVLKEYHSAKPTKAFFIVRLNGLKGQIDDYIGDINIYSPKIKQYIKTKPSFSEIESTTKDYDNVNAAVPIDFISLDRAEVYAKAKLEEIIDILLLSYHTKEPITIASNIHSVVNQDGMEMSCHVSMRGNDPMMASRNNMMQYLDALDLTDIKLDGFDSLSQKHLVLEVGKGTLKRQLKNATHWYAKAVAADKDIDILLYSWFAIEGLLKANCQNHSEMLDDTEDTKSLSVIQEFISSILCKKHFYSYLRETYQNFLYLTNQFNNYYDIKGDVITKAGLNLKVGDLYRDGDFLNAISDMIDCINDDIIKDELTQIQNFYDDDNGIKEKARQIKEDLLIIYRLRNMIVHNAALSCVNITFYAREIRYIAQCVIRYVMDNMNGNTSIDEIMLEAKLNYQVFLMNYDEELKTLKGNK